MKTQNKGDILADRIEKILQTPGAPPDRAALVLKALAEYRAPWTLGRSVNGHTLGAGQEWHRSDWTQEMLPDVWRPLTCNEAYQAGDQIDRYSHSHIDSWTTVLSQDRIQPLLESFFYRTTRPLPAVADPYAALKQAHAEGKVIESFLQSQFVADAKPSWNLPLKYYRPGTLTADGTPLFVRCEKEAK